MTEVGDSLAFERPIDAKTAPTAISTQAARASDWALRLAPSWKISAATVPPIRPPMCPPQEIPGRVKLITRLIRISPPTPLCITGI